MDLLELVEEYIQLPTRKKLAQMSYSGARFLKTYAKLYANYLQKSRKKISKQSLAAFVLSYEKPNTRAIIVKRLGKFLLWNNLITEKDYKELNQMFRFVRPEWSQKALQHSALVPIFKTILSISKTDFCKARNATLFFILAGTGCRISQALSLRLDDIIADEQHYIIRFPKSKHRQLTETDYETKYIDKEFSIGLHSINCWLERYLRLRNTSDNPCLFVTSKGQQYTAEEVRLFFNRLKQACAINITPHIIRHTIGTYVANQLSVLDANKLLGHSNITTTQLYINKSINPVTVPSIGKEFA